MLDGNQCHLRCSGSEKLADISTFLGAANAPQPTGKGNIPGCGEGVVGASGIVISIARECRIRHLVGLSIGLNKSSFQDSLQPAFARQPELELGALKCGQLVTIPLRGQRL